MLLPRSLTSRPQTTVTTIFRLSPKLLQPSKYIGMHQYHNFHDLGRNSSPIVPKLRRIPSTNYLHNPLNFGAAKIRFQVDQKFETTTFDKIPWLITSKLFCWKNNVIILIFSFFSINNTITHKMINGYIWFHVLTYKTTLSLHVNALQKASIVSIIPFLSIIWPIQ